jgi:hypothetical protein
MILIAASAALVTALAVPSVALAQTEDSVTGSLATMDAQSMPDYAYTFDVHSGPNGEDAGGTILVMEIIEGGYPPPTWLDVQALRVSGHTAYIAVTDADPTTGPMWIGVQDNGPGFADRFGIQSVPSIDPDNPPEVPMSEAWPSTANDVVVVDAQVNEPPVITVPDTITVPATGPEGATVTYTAAATDDVDGPLVPSCEPPSGSVFAIGTTTVTCTATDAAGNEASESFEVVVLGAQAQIDALIAEIRTEAPEKLRAPLIVNLAAAGKALTAGHEHLAGALLEGVKIQLKVYRAKQWIQAGTADDWIADVSRIQSVIG